MVSNVLTGGGDPSSISLMEGQGYSSLCKVHQTSRSCQDQRTDPRNNYYYTLGALEGSPAHS